MAPALVLPLVKIAVTRQLEESRPGPESDQVDDIVWSSEGKGHIRNCLLLPHGDRGHLPFMVVQTPLS
ncbi:unnamed protein product [Rangifer tarandus platyrhynchus]|uniref:Uncharacterized protein n=1 Tax=Rangifer tarandus platyrhynchus TaxID=3082113 RepID=A0AC59Y914_RANTA